MEEQSPQEINDQVDDLRPVASPPQAVTPSPTPAKPQLDVSDEAARSLLAIHDLEAGPRMKANPPLKLVIAVIGLILFLIVVSALVGTMKPKSAVKTQNPASSNTAPTRSSSSDTNNASDQVNKDIQACTNPVNALTEC